MSKGLPFDFEIPVSVFEKADAPAGQHRRIGGIVSLETKDRQEEVILQRGLDFSDFVQNGWLNDNHSRDTDGVVGYPEGVKFFRKGQVMPNGKKAPANGHWMEGYLLEGYERADRIWNLAKALEKTKRSLGFSVEGKILKRIGKKMKTIAKALVRNVAVTNCPVHTSAHMEILAKSLHTAEQTEDGVDKALGMGTSTGEAPVGSKTGMGAGQVITPESLEAKETPPLVLDMGEDEDEKKKKSAKKSLTDDEAFAYALRQMPNATGKQIVQFVELTKALKRKGKL